MKDSFLSVKKPAEKEIIIQKSRFICSVMPVDGDDEAKAFVSSVRAKYPDATHNCYAYVADEGGFYVKFSDDGEPQGTAGMPMLEVLKNRKLFKVATVVTRYFGGVKLGAGGLVRAYSESVCNALDDAEIIEYVLSSVVKVEVSFSLYPKILKYFSGIVNNPISTDFTDTGVAVTFAIPKGDTGAVKTAILDMSSGKSVCEIIEEKYEVYKK
ncbi:MAG: YigZ family protein [Clostridia bacterium]|nr:YigZ family protein [Clostridia bacterium]